MTCKIKVLSLLYTESYPHYSDDTYLNIIVFIHIPLQECNIRDQRDIRILQLNRFAEMN